MEFLALMVALSTPSMPPATSAQPAEAATDATPRVGSWRSTPSYRKSIAWDKRGHRLYWDDNGFVVGRYNHDHRRYEAGHFKPAYWHRLEPRIAARPVIRVGASAPRWTGRSTIVRGGVVTQRGTISAGSAPERPPIVFKGGRATRGNSSGVKVWESPQHRSFAHEVEPAQVSHVEEDDEQDDPFVDATHPMATP